MQCLERPGDEITFLKRHHVLHADGRLTIHTHHKHVLQLCSLLGLNAKNQNSNQEMQPPSERALESSCTWRMTFLTASM